MNKPLKIIGKVIEEMKIGTAVPVPTVSPKERPLSLKAQAAIKNVLAGDSKRKAMQKAGYSKYTAAHPNENLFNKKNVKDAVDPLLKQMLAHREELLADMRKKYTTANYTSVSMSFSMLTKDIQLLTGKATGKIGFEVSPEDRKMILDVLGLNAA